MQAIYTHEQAAKIQHEKEAKYLISEEKDLMRNYDKESYNHICLKDIDELKETSIYDLKLGINYGIKLISETIVEPRGIMNITTILEDKHCSIINCAIYNFTQIMQHSVNKLNNILPKHTKIIIKEPYIKMFTSDACSIRIDNPHTNLIVIDDQMRNSKNVSDHDLSKLNMLQLKNEGNNYYKQKYYNIAIRYYSIAIKKCNKDENKDNDLMMKLLNNRALCFLQLREYQQASKDGFKALSFDNNWIKARYTLCSALLGMKRYKEAMDVLSVMNQETLNENKLFKKMKQKLNDKVLQSSKRFHVVAADSKRYGKLCKLITYDTDYISNAMKIGWINGKKGRGMIATKNINAGEFLLRERYFAMGHPNKKWKHYANVNMEVCDIIELNEMAVKQVAFDLSTFNLIIDLIIKYKNGTDVDKYKISLLYDGSKRKENKYIPSMDTFKYNELPQNIKKKDIAILSMRRIGQIVEKNIFTLPPNEKIAKLEREKSDIFGNIPESLNVPSAAAIFLVSSFFNHSEIPNCVTDGDHERKIVMARTDIKKGQELTISYHYDDFTNLYPFNYNDP